LLGDDAIDQIASQTAESQIRDILNAIEQVESGTGAKSDSVVLAGAGEFLARRVLLRQTRQRKILSLSERFGPAISSAACAHALALLGQMHS
jgi:uncharacterized hydantoinase/oxoprolinase family protein